jgi:hypothetical protein
MPCKSFSGISSQQTKMPNSYTIQYNTISLFAGIVAHRTIDEYIIYIYMELAESRVQHGGTW